MAWRFHCWFQNFRLPFAAELNRYTYQELCCPIVPTVAILKLTSCLLSEAKISCSFPFSQCPSQLQENDLILLSESYKTRTAGEKAIRYRMTFHCCARSGSEVPAKRYIIHGWNFTRLRSPFDISGSSPDCCVIGVLPGFHIRRQQPLVVASKSSRHLERPAPCPADASTRRTRP